MSEPKGQKLTLKIDGSRVTAGKFESAVNNFFRLIADVSDEVIGESRSVEWVVSVREGSDLVEATPEPTEDVDSEQVDRALERILRGLEFLEAGTDERPEFFSDRALRSSMELARVKGGGIDEVALLADGRTRNISAKTIATVESLLEAKYSAYGSVEGRLESISLRQGKTFNVYRPPADQKVTCSFSSDRLQEVRDALDHRVSVWGEIKYRRDGTPIRCRMQELRVLGEKEELPGIYDVLGILDSPDNE